MFRIKNFFLETFFVKTHALPYLIQRYLGKFFQESLSSNQVTLDLLGSTGTLKKIVLDLQVINGAINELNLPFEAAEVSIEEIKVILPGISNWNTDTQIQVTGLKIVLQPKQRSETDTSMSESIWSAMTTSVDEFSKEMYNKQPEETHPGYPTNMTSPSCKQAKEGVKNVAHAMDSMKRLVKVRLIDTFVRLEYIPSGSSRGVGIELFIGFLEFRDVTKDDDTKEKADQSAKEDDSTDINTKLITIQNITISTVEFSNSLDRTLPETDDQDGSVSNGDEDSDVNTSLNDEKDLTETNHVIKFASLPDSFGIKIGFNHKENAVGPKLNISSSLSHLALFLSPRQVHLLLEVVNGFLSGEDTSILKPKPECEDHTMTGFDFRKVEETLVTPVEARKVYGLEAMRKWSTTGSEDNFLSISSMNMMRPESTISGYSRSMNTSVTSIGSHSTEYSGTSRRKSAGAEQDTAEVSQINVQIDLLAVILLHEDLLVPTTDDKNILVPSSVQQMQLLSENYFDQIKKFAITDDKRACYHNHIRLLATGVKFTGEERKDDSFTSTMGGDVFAGDLELFEYLVVDSKLKAFPLLKFHESPFSMIEEYPLKVHFRSAKKTKSKSQKNSGPNTIISISLGKCEVDFDISIIDRLSAIINLLDFFKDEYLNKSFAASKVHTTLDSITIEESRIDLKVACFQLILKLRFPIPDFRNENMRTPWWIKNVREDYLTLDCLDFHLKSSFQSDQAFQEYAMLCKELNIYYIENENTVKHLVSTEANEKVYASMNGVSLENRFNIKIFPTKSNDLEDHIEPESVNMTSSCYGVFEEQKNPDSGPFSSKKKVHHSDTPHSKSEDGKKKDTGELLLPGEKHEIGEFMKSATASSKIQIEVVLPIVTAQLTSKYVLEKLYNRINNDLLLWTPRAPKSRADLYHPGYLNYNYGNGVTAAKYIYDKSESSTISNNDTDSDIGDESSDLYFSSIDSQKKLKSQDSSTKGQSKLTLNMHIHQGLVCLNPLARDSTEKVIPGQQGEVVVNLGNTTIFFVSCYRGDQDLSYANVLGRSAQLYHCDMQPVPRRNPSLRRFDMSIPKNLLPTIYKSESGMLDDSSNRGDNRDMVTVAVRIKDNQTFVHNGVTKENGMSIQISIGLNKSTLRHRMIQEPNSWFSQLVDFFKLADYPIINYIAKDILTEMHLHLWDCAIDYRPLHLPIRTALTIGNFSITTNVTSLSNSSTASFTLEEVALLLSERYPPSNEKASPEPIHLRRDYFHVIGLGILEFSLKINEKATSENPRMDIRISNNILRFDTCADSAKMLLEFLTYIANEGDLTYDLEDDSPFPSPKLNDDQDQQLINIDSKMRVRSNITISDQERLNSDLLDAMKEETEANEYQEERSVLSSDGSTNVFYFPDERPSSSQQNRRWCENTSPMKPNPLVAQDLGDVTRYSYRSRNIEDDYEIIGNEPDIYPKDGKPEIKWLSNDPVRLVNDHFRAPPSSKVDVLQAPTTFPHAVVRYTLCDMSISWNIYGGNDFELINKDGKSKTKKKKTVNFSERTRHPASSSKSLNTDIHLGYQKKTIPWLKKGGVNRKHDTSMELVLTRIRFRHELYPETTIHASRQVLTISDICIKDKLGSSKMNKFLYHYVSEIRPKQSRAHMVAVKAIQIRPDTRINMQECSLKVSLLPLKLNIDQDTLRFLLSFFSEFASGTLKDNEENCSQPSTPIHRPPVMTIVKERVNTPEVTNDNLIMLNSLYQNDSESTFSSSSDSLPDNSPIYIRNFVFSPPVPIQIDFSGKVNFSYGLSEFLMGLAELNCLELTLPQLSCRDGLLGFDKVIEYAVQEFVNDVKKRQFPNLFIGVGPIKSIVKLGQGFTGLIMMPIEQYRKDGRILRGIQRGASNFKVSVVLASLDLLGRLVGLIQSVAEVTYDMLSPGPSIRYISRQKMKKKKKRYCQPQDIREGVTNAMAIVKDGFGEAAQNIVQVAAYEREHKGLSGAVGGVLREIPATMVKPLIVVTGATHDILGGVRNQLVPDARREANEKWRTDFIE